MKLPSLITRHSFGLEREAKAVEDAVAKTVESGTLTRDLNGTASTEEVGRAVIRAI